MDAHSNLIVICNYHLLQLQYLSLPPSAVGSCHIHSEDNSALATPTFRGSPPVANGYSTYSCVANNNCDNEVHVIGNYESNSQHSFNYHPTGYTDLFLSVTGNSSRPLILVLSSYEPVQWMLHIPSGVVLSKVIIVSNKCYDMTERNTIVARAPV